MLQKILLFFLLILACCLFGGPDAALADIDTGPDAGLEMTNHQILSYSHINMGLAISCEVEPVLKCPSCHGVGGYAIKQYDRSSEGFNPRGSVLKYPIL